MNKPQTQRAITFAAFVLLLMGLAFRVAPLANMDGRLLKQWPTEDGYLMLTIARNIALGSGMSTADGQIPTNGTQPLATWVWAAAFAATGGDKVAGVTVVLFFELLVSLAAAYLLYRLARNVFASFEIHPEWAMFCAAVWFASPLVIGHSMNALETGIYGATVVATLLAIQTRVRVAGDGVPTLDWKSAGLIAALLSLCFYARNDAVFLIGAFCVSLLATFARRPKITFGLFPKVLAVGSATVIFASPWLINNVVNFGHLMPISGVAQSASAGFADNVALLPTTLFEYFTLVVPIPGSIQSHWAAVLATSTAIILLLLWTLRAVTTARVGLGPAARVALIYSLCIALYYGLIHGAPWFMQRYLFPISPLLAIAAIAGLAKLAESVPAAVRRPAITMAGLLMVTLVAGLNVRIYLGGKKHMHDQVVNWVLENVPDEAWIGAVQTGTLGFFHDRTINLDGKVNPEALEAVLANSIPEYVNTKKLAVIADWYGVKGWIELTPIRENYALVVADSETNLAVLVRNGWVPQWNPERPVPPKL